MDSNICKICGTRATKLIFCGPCNTNAHSDCLLVTGHTFVNREFLNCPHHRQSFKDSREDTLVRFQDMLRFEFGKFKKEVTESYETNMEKIHCEINRTADRMAALDLKLARFDRSLATTGTSYAAVEETGISGNIETATGVRNRHGHATFGIKEQGTLDVDASAGCVLCSRHVQEQRTGRTSLVSGVKPLWGRMFDFTNISMLRRPKINERIRGNQRLNAKED